MARFIYITGPAGSGKSTISELLSDKIEKTLLLDLDKLRVFFKNPHLAPWDGEMGLEQYEISLNAALELAIAALTADYTVIFNDVPPKALYLDKIKGKVREFSTCFVRLNISVADSKERDHQRGMYLSESEIEVIHGWIDSLDDDAFDLQFNSALETPEKVAENIHRGV